MKEIKPLEINFATDEEARAFRDWAIGVITSEEYDEIREKLGYEKVNNKKDIVELIRYYRKSKSED